MAKANKKTPVPFNCTFVSLQHVSSVSLNTPVTDFSLFSLCLPMHSFLRGWRQCKWTNNGISDFNIKNHALKFQYIFCRLYGCVSGRTVWDWWSISYSLAYSSSLLNLRCASCKQWQQVPQDVTQKHCSHHYRTRLTWLFSIKCWKAHRQQNDSALYRFSMLVALFWSAKHRRSFVKRGVWLSSFLE